MKKLLSLLVLTSFLIGANAAFAADNPFSQLGKDIVSTNKKIVNDAVKKEQKYRQDQQQKQIQKYKDKIAKKEAEIKEIQASTDLTKNEKVQKINKVKKEINELNSAIKELK